MKMISGEFPDPHAEPSLYIVVTTCMIHGKCGRGNSGSAANAYTVTSIYHDGQLKMYATHFPSAHWC